jgi:hypothetical protein
LKFLGSNPQQTDETSPFVSVVCGHDKMQDGYERLFLHAASTPGSFAKLHPRMHLMTGRGILSSLGGWSSRLLRGIFGASKNLLHRITGNLFKRNYDDQGRPLTRETWFGRSDY